ncbi:MAG TPA: ATP-binding protein [Isosphaeraceae bacterium]|nr:ATP-binding protein [Isosphaeraceae bacterium]
MRQWLRHTLRGYALAVLVVGLALVLRFGFFPGLGTRFPFLFFFLGVVFTAWYGGLGPGLFAIALSAVAAEFFLFSPNPLLAGVSFSQFSRLSLFIAQGLLITPLVASLRAARHRAAASDQERLAIEERHKRILDRAYEGICTLDAGARIDYLNRRMAEMLGYTTAEMLGRTLFEFMDESARAEAEQRLERRTLGIDERFDRHVDFHFRRKDGSSCWGIVSTTPILDEEGSFKGALAMVTDVTERKGAERELAELLARERHARAEAQAASQAKDRFLAVLSHELRTPLMPVLLSVSAMQEDPETPASIRPSLGVARRNVELEARLIDDLLDINRITQGKLQLKRERVDAHELLQHAVSICRDDIEAAGLELDLRLAATHHDVEADPARLQQVFWNLIKNAVKFTPQGGRISISSNNEFEGSDGSSTTRLCVQVSDTGVGIEPELLPRIFEAFQQGESTQAQQFGGLGLGLAISRWVAEAHGGKLTAASTGKGQGATFLLELTALTIPAAAQALSPHDPDHSDATRALRILLAEDNLDTLKVMARLLRMRGYEVFTAENLESALKIAENHEFDMVVSDISLPDGSGLDLMRRLREQGNVKGIALSGFGMEDDIQRSRDAGFAAHLTKPIDARSLDEAILRVAREEEAQAIAS